VLFFAADQAVRARAAAALVEHDLRMATSADETMTVLSQVNPIIAFLDASSDAATALALVHHVQVLRPGCAVYLLVSRRNAEVGTEALSLGARGLLASPPTGDALASAITEVRSRLEEARELEGLRAEVEQVSRRLHLFERVLHLASNDGHTDALRTVTDGLVELTQARGGCVYATVGVGEGGCVRLATTGTLRELPNVCSMDELAQLVRTGSYVVEPLADGQRTLGVLLLDGPKRPATSSVSQLVRWVLSTLDRANGHEPDSLRDQRGRVYSASYMQDVSTREIEKAKRHGRRLSFLVLRCEAQSRSRLEDEVQGVVRDTDVVAALDDETLVIILAETPLQGAHVCRRRIERALRRERRGQVLSSRTGAVKPSLRVSAGIATFPHDGVKYERLLQLAVHRVTEDSTSPAWDLAEQGRALPALVQNSMQQSASPTGLLSFYGLDLSTPAFADVVASVCRELGRAGPVVVHATLSDAADPVGAARREALSNPASLVHVFDLRNQADHHGKEAVVVSGETGVWACCGNLSEGRFRGAHAWDPRFADLLVEGMRAAGEVAAG
jgi:ActR/RegA family two-component response regulator